MGTFKDAFNNIAKGLEDLSSLEVVTYKGTINLTTLSDGAKFDDVLKNAKAQGDFRIIANTKSQLDGDTRAFYDTNATAAEIEAHNALVDSATEKRAAVIKIFESLIVEMAK